jgi:hypothetical protein
LPKLLRQKREVQNRSKFLKSVSGLVATS